MDLKKILANTFVKWFKSCGIAGAFRFKILYWSYRLTGWHIRHREWDFVLDYLPPLAKWQKVSVLDVGCSRNLFCFELKRRGYSVFGIDLENYQDKFPGTFYKKDIRNFGYPRPIVDFVTCISVLEHIKSDKDIVLKEMIKFLKIGGRLLLTIPTKEFAQGHDWEGFNEWYLRETFHKLKDEVKVNLLDYTERVGQMCIAFERAE